MHKPWSMRSSQSEPALRPADGRASEAEIQEMQETLRARVQEKFRTAHKAFQAIDTDKSGTLSYEEIVIAMRHFGLPLSDDHVRQLCAVADVNGDGAIDYEEFARVVEKMSDNGSLM